uniref:Uncharacterized protein n=1 Tax=Anguilla anguilla TaxID=7936 RepID=A0A0E9TSB1_ANGAN
MKLLENTGWYLWNYTNHIPYLWLSPTSDLLVLNFQEMMQARYQLLLHSCGGPCRRLCFNHPAGFGDLQGNCFAIGNSQAGF